MIPHYGSTADQVNARVSAVLAAGVKGGLARAQVLRFRRALR